MMCCKLHPIGHTHARALAHTATDGARAERRRPTTFHSKIASRSADRGNGRWWSRILLYRKLLKTEVLNPLANGNSLRTQLQTSDEKWGSGPARDDVDVFRIHEDMRRRPQMTNSVNLQPRMSNRTTGPKQQSPSLPPCRRSRKVVLQFDHFSPSARPIYPLLPLRPFKGRGTRAR